VFRTIQRSNGRFSVQTGLLAFEWSWEPAETMPVRRRIRRWRLLAIGDKGAKGGADQGWNCVTSTFSERIKNA